MSCVQEKEKEANFRTDVVLIDGSTVDVRCTRREDAPLLLEFFNGLSEESIYFRFLGGGTGAESAVRMMLPRPQGFSLVALKGERILANAAYYVKSPGVAEVGIVVADAWRRKGLGTFLLRELSGVANRSGVYVFEALVVPENHLMIETVRNLGFRVTEQAGPGYMVMRYPTSPLPPIPVCARQ